MWVFEETEEHSEYRLTRRGTPRCTFTLCQGNKTRKTKLQTTRKSVGTEVVYLLTVPCIPRDELKERERKRARVKFLQTSLSKIVQEERGRDLLRFELQNNRSGPRIVFVFFFIFQELNILLTKRRLIFQYKIYSLILYLRKKYKYLIVWIYRDFVNLRWLYHSSSSHICLRFLFSCSYIKLL